MVASTHEPDTQSSSTVVRRRRAAFPPERILLVPGPSNLPPRVIQALSTPIVSHKDPTFVAHMDEVRELLQMAFETSNTATFALPATGGSGMEASLLNLLQPGDTAVIGVAGYFAQRMVAIADRIGDGVPGVEIVPVDAEPGTAIPTQQVIEAARKHNARVVAMVHGETSTGVEQPLEGIGAACRELGAYLIVDSVASFGGVKLPIDDLEIDICYSGSQKCLSAPPGLAPITVSDRAMQAIRSRKRAVPSWYLDLALHEQYWGPEHIYHHTAPILNIFALAEALRIIDEEGLDNRIARHHLHSSALQAGLRGLGLELFADAEHRLDTVVTVRVPEGVPAGAVIDALLNEYNIEIAGGLGPLAGKIWRIGVMGHSATRANMMLLLAALDVILARHGWQRGSGTAAAEQVYHRAGL